MATDRALFIVTIPIDQQEEKHQQETNDSLQSLSARLKVYLAKNINEEPMWLPSTDQKTVQVTFHAEFGVTSDRILRDLYELDIGNRSGSQVCVIPAMVLVGSRNKVSDITLTTNTTDQIGDMKQLGHSQSIVSETTMKKSIWKTFSESDFKKSVRARLMVHQVIAGIRAASALSFDFVVLLSLASMLAAVGLLESSSVILVASMLVSPLMNPIMGIVFGVSVHETSLWRQSIRNEVIGLVLCILWGFIIGLCTTYTGTNWGSSSSFPTSEMKARGDLKRLWVGVLIAVPSGAGVALSILGGNTGSLVGVAISASLLPPAVNCGLLFAYAIFAQLIFNDAWDYGSKGSSERTHVEYFSFQNRLHSNGPIANCSRPIQNHYEPYYSCNMAYEAAILGACSFLLTLVNIVCIIIMALIILRIKEVVPLHQTNETIQAFFKHDVKLTRDRNRTSFKGQKQSAATFIKSNTNPSNEFTLSGKYDDRQSIIIQEASSGATSTTLFDMNDLQMYVKNFNLDIFNENDRELLTAESEEKVSCLVKNILDMYEEDQPMFLDFCHYQPYSNPASAQKEYFIFYEHFIKLLPLKWYERFERERRRRWDIIHIGKQRANTFTAPIVSFPTRSRLNQSFNGPHKPSTLRRVKKTGSYSRKAVPTVFSNETLTEFDNTLQSNREQNPRK
ncbi:unnamed protein product [Adineta steineri]|uniref:Uncharacterized protein n=2 Tax=Adineta steineri TaxID=433720 RepID=A0A819T4U5_9BILA|nr:unnamed protein product [Adineta steineri]